MIFIVSYRIIEYHTVSYRIKMSLFMVGRSITFRLMATLITKKWRLKANKNKEEQL